MKRIIDLDFSYNCISIIERDSFQMLAPQGNINLADNDLNNIWYPLFSSHIMFQSVNLAGNHIHYMGYILKGIHTIGSLDVSRNGLTKLSSLFQFVAAINSLNVSHNNFNNIEENIFEEENDSEDNSARSDSFLRRIANYFNTNKSRR